MECSYFLFSGWHRRLNVRASTPPFYKLAHLLYDEAKFVETQVGLVSVRKLTKNQRKRQANMEGRIFAACGAYSMGTVITGTFMQAVRCICKMIFCYCFVTNLCLCYL